MTAVLILYVVGLLVLLGASGIFCIDNDLPIIYCILGTFVWPIMVCYPIVNHNKFKWN